MTLAQGHGRRSLAPATVRRKLSALSSLFDYLCERNAVTGNPVDGVKRPMANGNEGSTAALGDAQARKLLEAPPAGTLKGLSGANAARQLSERRLQRGHSPPQRTV
jgi:site-specific recombinase XerC